MSNATNDRDSADYLRGVEDGEILTEMPVVSERQRQRRPWYYQGLQESVRNSNQQSSSRHLVPA